MLRQGLCNPLAQNDRVLHRQTILGKPVASLGYRAEGMHIFLLCRLVVDMAHPSPCIFFSIEHHLA